MKYRFTYLNSFSVWLLMIMLMGVTQLASAQTKINVKGVVKDATGNVLPGATVNIEGTNQSTTTDVNGAFKIDVAEGSTLRITFVS
ncbi:MAG: TonB-linked outer membrane protein SusC/RagA family, partial [Mucilaginibacter sp.]|nr:TonB-linked outer membrane protein SusC/RagA family [Mucilaginibacter sp.]